MNIRLVAVVCSVVCASLCVAPGAFAAHFLMSEHDLVYDAGSGEVNRVTMTNGPLTTDVVIEDTGAGSITDLSGKCTVTGNVATCHLAAVRDVYIDLGNKNDTYTAASCSNCYRYSSRFSMIVIGGKGNDALRGSKGPDTMIGGAGNDLMDGKAGDDYFIEMDAADGSDTFIGGPGGMDFVSYYPRSRPVIANLDGRRNDGQRSERDKIGRDIEGIEGGSGADRLTGNSKSNGLFGGAGADVLNGAGGADDLWGGNGSDTLIGGSGLDSLYGEDGDDTLRSRDASQDTVNGGAGSDSADRDARDQIRSIERFI